MDKVKILIVDDEKRVRSSIRHQIEMYFGMPSEISEAANIDEAEKKIEEQTPDILLLDIKMQNGSGFQLLEKYKSPDFKVIFITAYSNFAIDAFKFSALDYLLKPVDPEELVASLNRAVNRIDKETTSLKLKVLLENIPITQLSDKKIILNSIDKADVVSVREIIKCEADRNYTMIYLTGNRKIHMSKPLGEYEEMLKSYGFFRCHNSFLINLSMVLRLEKKDGGVVVMKDNSFAQVSSRKYNDLIEAIKKNV
jgi:two-component system, LytTR family, response regulator